jgi:hypothetical protein
MRSRMPALVASLAAGVAAMVIGLTAPASAAHGGPVPDLVYLYTAHSHQECTTVGARGRSDHLWTEYQCRTGVAGWSVLVRPTPYGTGSAEPFYVTTFDSSQACGDAGWNGIRGAVWHGYDCRLGFAGYSLMVWA